MVSASFKSCLESISDKLYNLSVAENCPVPANASGYTIVNNIRSIAQNFGSVKLFKAYLEIREQFPASRAPLLHSELQSSGVSLTDCPHNGRKDVADKMIIGTFASFQPNSYSLFDNLQLSVDMLAHAIDNPAPTTIVLISGDRDFAYALAILRLRCYRVVLITLSNAHPSLLEQASLCIDWVSDVVELAHPASNLSHQPMSPRRGRASSSSVHVNSFSDPKGHNHSRYPFQEPYDEQPASNVELVNKFRDQNKENSRTPTNGFSTLNLKYSDPAASSMASDASCNNPELPPVRVMRSPVASSYHSCAETPLTVTARGSNSPRTTSSSNTYAGDMSPRFSPCDTLRSSAILPNLVSATHILPVESSLQDSAFSSQQSNSLLVKAKVPSLLGLGVDQVDEVQSDISSPPPLSTPPSPSVLSSMPPPSLINRTVPAASLEPKSFPAIPDKFKILIQCLKSHRSKGKLRPLRYSVAIEIARGGATYRQAGVSKFRSYVSLAEQAGIVELGGSESTAWIALKAPWYDVPIP